MRKIFSLLLLIFLLNISFKASAQTNKPYTYGSLWQIGFIQVKPGMGDLYLKNLSDNWLKIMRQAKADGLITDFKVLEAQAAGKDDWNMVTMYQLKNFAAIDGLDEKMEAIRGKIIGNEE